MVNITLSVPEDMKQEMDEFKEMNWSEVARASIKKRLILLREFKEFTKNSELSEEDAIRLGREVNKAVAKKFRELKK
ncbi:MAG TPA: hypothetical protein VJ438_02805 [Candidatus Nanoarchaeia archaeon]|nr:hypothetical protein [Candidatus Nanoarchaeia archaeon]